MTYFGEGSTANGQWHEAMNFAGIHRLPVVFVLENNKFAYSTPNELEFAVDPVRRADGYGFPGVSVDGNDVEAVFEASRGAVDRARAGEGPTLIECHTMRMHGHGAHDDMSYVPPELFEEWKRARPDRHVCDRLVAEHGFERRGDRGAPGRRARAGRGVRAQGDRVADAGSGHGADGVFADAFEPLGDGSGAVEPMGGVMSEMTYLEAISDGLREEMRRDHTVFCLGEDIGVFGGAFKVTAGFHEEFGAERVLDMPLAENLIIGAAVGAAVEGMRPVCEMQFADFIACGFDQLVNVAAKLHYRQGVAVPMVVRLPSGGGFSGGPFHSQNPEAWFLQAPGLKVVAPATCRGREGPAGQRDQGPEPGHVPGAQAPVPAREAARCPTGSHTVPIGKAHVVRAGEEMTILAYGSTVGARTAGCPRARRGRRDRRPAHALPARPRRRCWRACARPARCWSHTRPHARAEWAQSWRR